MSHSGLLVLQFCLHCQVLLGVRYLEVVVLGFQTSQLANCASRWRGFSHIYVVLTCIYFHNFLCRNITLRKFWTVVIVSGVCIKNLKVNWIPEIYRMYEQV